MPNHEKITTVLQRKTPMSYNGLILKPSYDQSETNVKQSGTTIFSVHSLNLRAFYQNFGERKQKNYDVTFACRFS